MVKYGRHLAFLRNRLPEELYLVEYKELSSRIQDPESFAAEWKKALAASCAAKDASIQTLWTEVFTGLGSGLDADRGLRPIAALRQYREGLGTEAMQRLIDQFSEARTACIANWEALRKLVKKYDKHAVEQGREPLSRQLLPSLYGSALTGLLHSDDLSPFEAMKQELLGHDQESTSAGEERDPPASAAASTLAEDEPSILQSLGIVAHAVARRAPVGVPGASLALAVISRWAPSLLGAPAAGARGEAASLGPILERVRAWQQAGQMRASTSKQAELSQMQRRADELGWLRSLVAHDVPAADLAHLVAHRGFHSTKDRSDRRPIENSLEAYELAWTSGILLCECDVAVTRDGKLVLGHDADYSRLALRVPGEEAKRQLLVGELTLAELMAMPLKSGSRPPTLLEVLRSASMVGGGAQLVVEIKPGNVTAADALIGLLGEHPELLAVIGVVMSFDAFIMNDFAPKLAELAQRGRLATGGGARRERPQRQLSKLSPSSFRSEMKRLNASMPANLSELGKDDTDDAARRRATSGEARRAPSLLMPLRESLKCALPNLLLLTVADKPANDVENWLDVNKDTEEVEKLADGLDGVYIEFQKEMLLPTGQEALRAMTSRRLVGVWTRAGVHPDDLASAQSLIHHCGVRYVNTDLPTNFCAAPRRASPHSPRSPRSPHSLAHESPLRPLGPLSPPSPMASRMHEEVGGRSGSYGELLSQLEEEERAE